MKKILFISNITNKITGFAHASITNSHKLNFKYYHFSNWSGASKEQIYKDEKSYNISVENAPVARSPFSYSNVKAYKQLKALIKSENIDYIHCNTPVGGMIGRIAGKACKVSKIIYQAHGFHFYKGAPFLNWILYYPVEKILAHFTDAIITMNEEDYKNAQKMKLRKNGKVYFVHGVGIDTDMYKSVYVDVQAKRAELCLKEDDIVLISMGDLINRKNYSVAIKAIAKLNSENVHYLICGKGPELDNLKALADELGVSRQIHFLGFRSDIKELAKISDIFLFTTLQEGLPRSMMEAMVSGLPCIASKIRGNVDLIEDGVNGYLCEPTDVEGFAKAIETIVFDEELRNSMKKANLEKIKGYDISVVESEIEKIYREVLN